MEAIEGARFYAIEGVRFYPTDRELIGLLEEKRLNPSFSVHTILETNIYKYEPRQLFGLLGIRQDEKWSNFFCPPDYLKGNSERLKKLTETGYCSDHVRRSTKTGSWKKTGQARFIKAKRSKENIGLKRTLVFYEGCPGSKNVRTNWVMHEFVIKYDPSFQKDFVLCRIKRKRDNKRCISTENENKRAKRSRTPTTDEERRSKRSRVSTKNEDRRAKGSRVSTKKEDRRAKKPRVSLNDEAQPSHDVAFDNGIPDHHTISGCRNRFVRNNSSESQCDPISRRNHVAENSPPQSQPLPSCDLISNSVHQVADAEEAPECDWQVDSPPRLTEPSALIGYSGMDETSFPGQLLQTHPEQASSYSGITNGDYDVMNSHLGAESEDYATSCATQVEGFGEETGQRTPLYPNPSKSARGLGGEDSSDMDTESFEEWVSKMFVTDTSEACLNLT